MGRRSAKNQYYAAFGANISTLIYGITSGWASPNIPILKSNETPIASGPLTSESLSWIASIMCLGGVAGTILYGYIIDVIGRRISLWSLAIPHLICYALILVAENKYYLFVARFMGGVAGGATFILIPVYITEISEDRIRGALGSILVLSCNIGILIAFIISSYCTYRTASIIYTCLPFIYLAATYWLPETPFHLIKQNKFEEAEKSLSFYRNAPTEDMEIMNDKHNIELQNLKSLAKDVDGSVRVTYKDFVTRQALKALGIGFGLIFLNQGCGVFALLNYTQTIFEEGGSSMSPNMSAMIVAFLQVVGSYISTILVDKTGRKFCLTLSSFGTCFGLVVMGTYQYFKQLEYNLESYLWIPVISFSFAILIASCGIITLPFVVLSEIMPEKIRSTAVSMAMSFSWILAFIFLRNIYTLFEEFGLHGASYFFASISFFGSLFIVFCVPETKGKSLEEIQKLL